MLCKNAFLVSSSSIYFNPFNNILVFSFRTAVQKLLKVSSSTLDEFPYLGIIISSYNLSSRSLKSKLRRPINSFILDTFLSLNRTLSSSHQFDL